MDVSLLIVNVPGHGHSSFADFCLLFIHLISTSLAEDGQNKKPVAPILYYPVLSPMKTLQEHYSQNIWLLGEHPKAKTMFFLNS